MRFNICLIAGVLAVGLISLGGCRSTVDAPALSQKPFDAREAAYIKTKGEGKISGHAFWRDSGGGVTNAAGETVRLVPATAYARERFIALYRGRKSVDAGSIPKVEPDPQYAEYTRTTRAESTGRFEFDDVAPGVYYVATQMIWTEKNAFKASGGAMFESVTVGRNADTQKVVVTNER